MKIAVLLSGGVDSSVALALLKQQGHDVTAFYLKIWLEDELSFLGECPWEDDLQHVRAVCEQLQVPLEIISLQKEYHQEVVSYVIAQVRQGLTPNPDVLCNQRIKFGVALTHIGNNFDKVASGHYAVVEHTEQGSQLLRAVDDIKDQTYFLSYLSQIQLKKLIFPVGVYAKEQVRILAQQFQLPNAQRKDSQGICFLGKLKFNDFLHHYLGKKAGNLVEIETGQVMGAHDGFWYHTIGQRQGMKLSGGPWYVAQKDPANNIVYISRNYYSLDKTRDRFVAAHCNWIAGCVPNKKNVQIKLRHGALLYDATIEYEIDNCVRVAINGRDQGIAAGQFAVFYDGSVCLGAGIIVG